MLHLFRHSRLNGSDDLGNWMRDAQDNVVIAVNEHLLEPLADIYDEFFQHKFMKVSDCSPETVCPQL